MNRLSIQRREELLRLAEELAMRLRTARVPYVNDPSEHAAGGIAASTLAHADSHLARVRDVAAFREFLAHFDALDRMTAQNVDNPKAEHRIARQEIESLLEAHPNLSADELLYLLAWSRRLLPRQPGPTRRSRPKGDSPSGKRGGPTRERRRGGSKPFKGSQLAQEIEKLRGNEDRGKE